MKYTERTLASFVALAALLMVFIRSLPTQVHSQVIFIVNSTGDGADANSGDAVCDTAPPSGICTLRAAIEEANGLPGSDTVNFSIGSGVQTIQPQSALPTISGSLIIDGTTQPGYAGSPIIELNGTGAGALVDGLRITAGSSTVRGLVINRFGTVLGSDGIELQLNGGNVIEGNFIGTDVTGAITDPDGIPANGDELRNAGDGIFINGGNNNTIGGTTAGARNVISGNFDDGLEISGSTGNIVRGNLVGTDVTGANDRGNTDIGVVIGSANNTIGGTAVAARNVISGNNSSGIAINGSGSTGNVVQGNYIGTDTTGAIDRGNSTDGVSVVGAPNNTIGGTTAAERNVISGNNSNGVEIQGSGATGNLV